MNHGLIIDTELAGAIIANSDDMEQARFFRGFVKEMMSWPNCVGREMQLMHVNKRLTIEERDLLKNLTCTEELND